MKLTQYQKKLDVRSYSWLGLNSVHSSSKLSAAAKWDKQSLSRSKIKSGQKYFFSISHVMQREKPALGVKNLRSLETLIQVENSMSALCISQLQRAVSGWVLLQWGCCCTQFLRKFSIGISQNLFFCLVSSKGWFFTSDRIYGISSGMCRAWEEGAPKMFEIDFFQKYLIGDELKNFSRRLIFFALTLKNSLKNFCFSNL